MLLKVEDGLGLGGTVAKLESLLPCGEPFAHPYAEKKRGQASALPKPTHVTMSGFCRYSNPVASLPASEKTRASARVVSQISSCRRARS
jgi:hypothetical protein